MRKAGFIAMAIAASTLLITPSCGNAKAAGNGYFGVSNTKVNKQRQKEFSKPKAKIKKSKPIKRGS